jgi:transmembrane sensor
VNSAENRNTSREDEAGTWDARLRAPNCKEQERAAHREWMQAHPRNAKAFEELQAIINDLPRLAATPEIQSMRAAAVERMYEDATETSRRRHWLPIGGAIAASLAIMASATIYLAQPSQISPTANIVQNDPTPTFSTEIGERTDVALNDGSAATLNTDSKINVRYREDERAILLVKGEAHFNVAHNKERPFVVYAGDYKVIAVGTAFDVKAIGKEVEVTVTEGKVQVIRIYPDGTQAPQGGASLVAGQQFSGRQEGPSYRRKADIAKATSWRKGNAIFDDLPLQLAANEMNRYSNVKLTITDPQLASTRINGMFITGSQDSFVEALEAYFGVKARRKSDTEILLEPAR